MVDIRTTQIPPFRSRMLAEAIPTSTTVVMPRSMMDSGYWRTGSVLVINIEFIGWHLYNRDYHKLSDLTYPGVSIGNDLINSPFQKGKPDVVLSGSDPKSSSICRSHQLYGRRIPSLLFFIRVRFKTHVPHFTLEVKPRQHRAYNSYKKNTFPTMEDMLLFIYTHMKTCLIQQNLDLREFRIIKISQYKKLAIIPTLILAILFVFKINAYSHSFDKDIEKTQKTLKKLGYDPGSLDGIWGNKTFEALETALNDLSKFLIDQQQDDVIPQVVISHQPINNSKTLGGIVMQWMVILFVFLGLATYIMLKSVVKIDNGQVGLIYRKFGRRLPPDRTIAFNNEVGWQAKILSTGWHFGYWGALFTIKKEQAIYIGPSEIGLVEARDGDLLLPNQTFGRSVSCNSFQDAQAFINNGGQRGKQLEILTTGTYRINTKLFDVSNHSVVSIQPDELGLIEARDGDLLLPNQTFGRSVSCNSFQNAQAFINNGGQRGKQLEILRTGTYRINTEFFHVDKVPLIHVRPGEIALVVAEDGEQLPAERMLGRSVDCNNFQDAQAFINNGGQRGKQLEILRTGTYQINTDLFKIITVQNALEYDIAPENLQVYTIPPRTIGIVTTFDGAPVSQEDIAGPRIEGHSNFQDGQKFIDLGGCRGLQEEILLEGTWNLNPWFVKVEQESMMYIPNGTVGVVISNVGKSISKINHDLVDPGYKGIWNTPLSTGLHPINTRAMRIVLVPTTEITLNWSNESKPPSNYDAHLNALELRSSDGFPISIEVTQVIRIVPEDAPKMISRVVSEGTAIAELDDNHVSNSVAEKYPPIRNLVTRVLEPMVGTYFLDTAQAYEGLNFLRKRDEIKIAATEHISAVLQKYSVQTVGTFITNIELPPQLEEQLQEKKIAEVKRETYEIKRASDEVYRTLVESEAKTAIQAQLVHAQSQIDIAEMESEAELVRARARLEANQIEIDQEVSRAQQISSIEIDAFRARVAALTPEVFAELEAQKGWAVAAAQMKITFPEFLNIGSGSNTSGDLNPMTAMSQLMNLQVVREIYSKRDSTSQLSNSLPTNPLAMPSEQKGLPEKISEPRCPIALLIDTSSSMFGERINRLNTGLATFKHEILKDYVASHLIDLSIITYGSSAQSIHDFANITQSHKFELFAGGDSAMGQGLTLMLDELEKQLTIYKNMGIKYHRPWTFLIINSQPTDDWESAVSRVKQSVEDRIITFFVIDVQGANAMTLRQLSLPSNSRLILEDLKFEEMFHWLASSMKQVSSQEVGSTLDLAPVTDWAHIS